MRYLVVLEKSPRNYSAFSPDVPGCIATGRTLDETKTNMREALQGHIEVMMESGEAPPAPTSWSIVVQGYNVPIEKTGDGYRAEPPDLPDISMAADSPERVEALVREAVARHLDSRSSEQPPGPTAEVVHIEIETTRPLSIS